MYNQDIISSLKNNVLLNFITGIVQTTSATMTLSKNAIKTKEALFFFDDLFDSFNGNSEQGLSCIVTQNSGHLTFWQEAVYKLSKMEFVELQAFKKK